MCCTLYHNQFCDKTLGMVDSDGGTFFLSSGGHRFWFGCHYGSLRVGRINFSAFGNVCNFVLIVIVFLWLDGIVVLLLALLVFQYHSDIMNQDHQSWAGLEVNSQP